MDQRTGEPNERPDLTADTFDGFDAFDAFGSAVEPAAGRAPGGAPRSGSARTGASPGGSPLSGPPSSAPGADARDDAFDGDLDDRESFDAFAAGAIRTAAPLVPLTPPAPLSPVVRRPALPAPAPVPRLPSAGPQEGGSLFDSTAPLPKIPVRPPRDPLTPEIVPTGDGSRVARIVAGDFLLTVNPVDGTEVVPCPPGERPTPVRRTRHERVARITGTRPTPPPGPPAPELPLLERDEERERLIRLLARGRSIRVTGPSGAGRTALLESVANACGDLAPDGVLWLSGYRRTAADLLQDLYAIVYSGEGYRPGRAELPGLLRQVGAVVVLDDLEFGGAALEELLAAAPECAFLMSATPEVPAPAADSMVEEVFLSGLTRTACVELLQLVAVRRLEEDETAWAADLWFESEGLPLRFVQAGALLRQRDALRTPPEPDWDDSVWEKGSPGAPPVAGPAGAASPVAGLPGAVSPVAGPPGARLPGVLPPVAGPPGVLSPGAVSPVAGPPGVLPPGALPPVAGPPGARLPGVLPPVAGPPGAVSPGAVSPVAGPPGVLPPGALPPVAVPGAQEPPGLSAFDGPSPDADLAVEPAEAFDRPASAAGGVPGPAGTSGPGAGPGGGSDGPDGDLLAADGIPAPPPQLPVRLPAAEVPLPSLAESAAPADLLASRLSESAREALAFAVALDGECPHASHLPALVGDTHGDAALGELTSVGLAVPVSSHFRLATGVVQQLTPTLTAEGELSDVQAHTAALHYAWWTGHSSVTPERAAAEAEAILAAMTACRDGGHADAAVLLARTVAPAFAVALHWGAWERALRVGQEAARLSGEVAQEAYFHHELGVLALCTGNADRARAELEASIALRGALADRQATVVGRRTLTLVNDHVGSGASALELLPAALTGTTPLALPEAATVVIARNLPARSAAGSGNAHARRMTVLASRRNLLAAGTGAVIAAVLGTIVTMGATSNGDGSTPNQVKPIESVQQDVPEDTSAVPTEVGTTVPPATSKTSASSTPVTTPATSPVGSTAGTKVTPGAPTTAPGSGLTTPPATPTTTPAGGSTGGAGHHTTAPPTTTRPTTTRPPTTTPPTATSTTTTAPPTTTPPTTTTAPSTHPVIQTQTATVGAPNSIADTPPRSTPPTP